MATQMEEAHELLRAALQIIRRSGKGPYVRSAYEVETEANGGGDGMCVAEEIEDYFSMYGVSKEPQFPAEREPTNPVGCT